MTTTFNFNSYDNSKQNNTVIINNDVDKILETLKEVNVTQEQINELKVAIKEDEKEVKKTNSIGTNVKNWCNTLFNQISIGAITNIALPIVQEKLQSALLAIYHFPIRF
ncbi:MAG: hypothetical protein ACLSUS_05485 [Opitutales bacterium]|jgi:hypothetical protein|nr:hypothetical protein [Clostridium sp.]